MTFTFIDLFAGIGGFRLGLERAGGRCVFTSEIDKSAQTTYLINFSGSMHGDITKYDAKYIPDHDVLAAGFPCQPFSLAGVGKKKALGHALGFADKTKGTLFFDIARILKAKRPRAFILENVPRIQTIDGGRAWQTITDTLQALGYDIHYKVIDARAIVPQRRKRVYIVGIRSDLNVTYELPELPDLKPKARDILESNPAPKYTLSPQTWQAVQDHKARHEEQGHGFGYNVIDPMGVANTLMSDSGGLRTDNLIMPTLPAHYAKEGKDILIAQHVTPRRLTPRECARLMGFPDSFKIPVADTNAYRQFGNAVVPGVIEHIARSLYRSIDQN